MESSKLPEQSPAGADAASPQSKECGNQVDDKKERIPPPSDQMRASGTGRRKVPLPPGRSQLDWIRNSRTLPPPSPKRYTSFEVKKHRQKGDAWTVVRGMVFNITPYLEYHPGGIEMIMAGAGKVSICTTSVFRPGDTTCPLRSYCLLWGLTASSNSRCV
jgi:Cytochrome b5-like Heme/Steroid binding domain